MQQKNTFNLAFVFGRGEAVCVIVCYSDDPIDPDEIRTTAASYLHSGIAAGKNMRGVISGIVNGIREDCGVDVVLVNADAACVVQKGQF